MPPLTFDKRFEPNWGTAVPVAPGIRRLTCRNPGPYTFHGTNTYLIGERALTVVDPGPIDDAHIAAILQAAGGGRIDAILLTHSHGDHSPGARPLSTATGAPILGGAASGRAVNDGGESGSDPRALVDRELADGDAVPTQAGALRVVATPGHAADHLVFALEGSGQLFSGDHVMAWSTSVVAPPDGSMADYVGSLDRVAARPETTYWPGHGGPVRDGPAFAAALKAHRMDREAMIMGAIRAGSTTIPAIVAAVYPDLDPVLADAAARSAQAHLDWLEAKRLVIAETDAPGLRTYRPA